MEEETISLNELFDVVKKRLKVIISLVVAITLLVALVSIFILTPVYEASSQFIVNEPKDDQTNQFDSNTIRTNVEVINTYNVIITSSAILNDVIRELDLSYSASTLASKLSVTSEQNSQVVTVTVTDPDQKVAAEIANATVMTFQKKIPEIMNVDNVKVLTAAEQIDNPKAVKPNVKLNIAIGLVLGMMVALGVAFLLEYLDTSIKTEKDIERLIQVPVIGVISTVSIEDLRENSTEQHESMRRVKRGRA